MCGDSTSSPSSGPGWATFPPRSAATGQPSWSTTPSSRRARSSCSAALIGKYSRANEVYTAWLEMPSLRTIAWEAICQENGVGIAAMTADELLKESVPVDLVKMLGASRTKRKGGEQSIAAKAKRLEDNDGG